MEKSFVLGVIALVKSGLTGCKADIPEDFDYKKAFKVAKAHGIIPVVYYGICNSGIVLEGELNNLFFSCVCQCIAIDEKQRFETDHLIQAFDENSIDYMLLKGTVIRSMYPNPEMRSMGDADILIKEEQYSKIVPILEKSGFNFVKESGNELCWEKSPFFLELHRFLVSPRHKDYFKFFGTGWQYARLTEGYENRYEMSDEDFFVFLFAHMT